MKGHTWGDQLSHSPLDNSDSFLGVFQLVADGDPMARANQLGQVIIERMVRKSGQFNFTRTPVSPFREDDVQHRGGLHSIFSKRFIEISDAKQQQRIRIIGFDPIVLLHQRCFLFGHGLRPLSAPTVDLGRIGFLRRLD